MFSIQNTLSVSDLRKNTIAVLERVNESEEPLTIFSNSKPVAVLMSIVQYAELQMDAESTVNPRDYAKALDFLINPPSKILIKKKGLNAVDIIRKERD